MTTYHPLVVTDHQNTNNYPQIISNQGSQIKTNKLTNLVAIEKGFIETEFAFEMSFFGFILLQVIFDVGQSFGVCIQREVIRFR